MKLQVQKLGEKFPWCGLFLEELYKRLSAQTKTNGTAEVMARLAEIVRQAPRYDLNSNQLRMALCSFVECVPELLPDDRSVVKFKMNFERCVASAATHITNLAVVEPRIAALMDEYLVTYGNWRLRPNADSDEHVMLGYTQFKTNYTGSKGVRLLMLDSCDLVGFNFWNGGVIEFWIDPDDLAHRRFEFSYAKVRG